jgi:hypothetical protein
MTLRILCFTIAAALLCAASSYAKPAGYEEAALVADAFHAALQKGDRGAALAALDDSVQIYEQGWVENSKAEYADHHLGADMKFAAATTSRQTARNGSLVGDLAFVTTESANGTFEAKPVDTINLETMVLRRSEKGWRIVHIHWSSRKPKS